MDELYTPPSSREEKLAEYWDWIQKSQDTSHSGLVVSPSGWLSAVTFLLAEVNRLDEEVQVLRYEKKALKAARSHK